MTFFKRSTGLGAALLLIMLLLTGCGAPLVEREALPPTPEAARSILSANQRALDRFDADFRLKLNALIYQGSFHGTVQLEQPANLRARLLAPFGMKAGEVVVRDGRYQLDSGRGDMHEGALDSLDLERLTGVPFPSKNLRVLFNPVAVPPAPEAKTLQFQVREDSLWLWTVDEGHLQRHILLDPVHWRTVEETWENRRGDLVLKKSYDRFISMQGLEVPWELTVRATGNLPVKVTIEYDNVKLNPEWGESPFRFFGEPSHGA